MITTYDLIICFLCGAITAECLRYIIRNVAKIIRHIRRERRLRNQSYNRQRFDELVRQTQLPGDREEPDD